MKRSYYAICPFCGGVATTDEGLKLHTRAQCEKHLEARITVIKTDLDRAQRDLEALHAVRVEDWSDALS